MVEMSIEAENLTEASLDISEEALRKARALSNPVAASEGRQRSVEVRRRHSDRSIRVGSVKSSRCIGRRTSGNVVNGKCFRVTQFPYNPALDKGNVLACWYFDWNLLVIEPGVGMTSIPFQYGSFELEETSTFQRT